MDELYFNSLVRSVTNNIGLKSNNMIFIKHYNSLDILSRDMLSVEKEDNIKVLFFEYKSSVLQEAYEPFIEWIKEIYMDLYADKITINEFLQNCKVYPKLVEVLASMIMEGKCKKIEDILVSEIKGERIHLYNSLNRIYSYVSKEIKLFMVISKIHLANYSSLEWLYQFFNEHDNENIGYLIIYNDAYPITTYTRDILKKILNLVENRNCFFDWDIVATENIIEPQNTFVPNKNDIKEYIIKTNNMYYTHATKQALYYLNIINQSLERDRLEIDIEDKYVLYALYALISISAEDYNTAVVLAGNYLYIDDIEPKYQYWFNYIYGLAHISLLQINMAKICANKCFELANQMNDEMLIFKAEYLKFISCTYNWSQMFMVDFSEINVKQEFLRKLEKYGFISSLAYIYVYSFENDKETLDAYASGKLKSLEYFEKGIAIGEKMCNTTFLRSAYMKNIVLYSQEDYHEVANEFYKKRLEIVKLEKNRLREAHVYNGLGYNCIIVEKYNQSEKYIKKGIDMYCECKAVNHIAEALYNLATNSFVAGDYKNTCYCVNIILYILKNLKLRSVQMCNASKLYGMAALSYYYMDEIYKCISLHKKMAAVMSHILTEDNPDCNSWYEDLCFYYLIKGVLIGEKDFNKALEELLKAKSYEENVKGNKFVIYSCLAIELSKMYRKCGQEENAIKILNDAIGYSNEKGYIKKAAILTKYLNRDTININDYTCELSKEVVDNIKMLSDLEGKRIRLEECEKDIHRLSKWQEVLKAQKNDLTKLIDNTMSSVINGFNMDGGIYIEFEDNEYKVKYKDDKYEYSQDVIDTIVSFFIKKPKRFFVDRTDKQYHMYEELINIFGVNKIATLIGIPRIDNMKVKSIFVSYIEIHRNFTANVKLMTEDNLNIIGTAFEQIVLFYSKRIKANEIKCINDKLKKMSYTDNLTGLYNRQGLYNIVMDNNVCNNAKNMVLYIDLDNFKSYNDVFGHAIGDAILVYFANVLKVSVEDYGYAVRYGGDEFIAILQDVVLADVEKIVKNIRKNTKNKVTDILYKNYSGNANIPDNKDIACSIGIAGFDNYSYEDIVTALNKADKALCHIKYNNKGKSIFWNDL